MSKNYRLIIFLTLFMLGCAPSVIDENKVIQKIDSLDMTIFSKSGDKIYSITSPNSSYDNIELKFELKKPIINILNGKETKYIISSEESTLSDKNNYEINSENAFYNLDTESVSFEAKDKRVKSIIYF